MGLAFRVSQSVVETSRSNPRSVSDLVKGHSGRVAGRTGRGFLRCAHCGYGSSPRETESSVRKEVVGSGGAGAERFTARPNLRASGFGSYARLRTSSQSLFPAHAGMTRLSIMNICCPFTVPRTRRDDPITGCKQLV